MTDPFMGVTGVNYQAGSVWEHVADLTERIETRARDGEQAVAAALTVLVFSAVSLETFLNELVPIAEGVAATGDGPSAVIAAKLTALGPAPPTRRKFDELGKACAQPLAKGAEPYNSFDRLIRIRNSIVHGQPHRHTYASVPGGPISVHGPHADLLDELWKLGLIEDPGARPMRGVFELLADPRLCRWACDTTQRIVRHVLGILPPPLASKARAQLGRRLAG